MFADLSASKDSGPSQTFALAQLAADVVETALKRRGNNKSTTGYSTEFRLKNPDLSITFEKGCVQGQVELKGKKLEVEVIRSFLSITSKRHQVLSFAMDYYRALDVSLPDLHHASGNHYDGEWVEQLRKLHQNPPADYALKRGPAVKALVFPK